MKTLYIITAFIISYLVTFYLAMSLFELSHESSGMIEKSELINLVFIFILPMIFLSAIITKLMPRIFLPEGLLTSMFLAYITVFLMGVNFAHEHIFLIVSYLLNSLAIYSICKFLPNKKVKLKPRANKLKLAQPCMRKTKGYTVIPNIFKNS